MALNSKRVQARSRAVSVFRVLAILEIVLAAALGTMGGIATIYESGAREVPYYVGAFMVGALMVLGALVTALITCRGRRVIMSESKTAGVACLITTHYVLTILTLMGCFLAVILTGMFGLCEQAVSCHRTNVELNKDLSITLTCLIVAAFAVNVAAMITVCTYGSYFGVNFKHHGRHHVGVIWSTDSNRVSDSAGVSSNNTERDARTQQAGALHLHQENLLLQQQILKHQLEQQEQLQKQQKQLIQQQQYMQQQQQQQHLKPMHQPGGSGYGEYPPRPSNIAPPQYSVDDPLQSNNTVHVKPSAPPDEGY